MARARGERRMRSSIPEPASRNWIPASGAGFGRLTSVDVAEAQSMGVGKAPGIVETRGIKTRGIAEAQELWQPRPGWLNTASYGLPPRPGWEALMSALTDWREGRTSWEGWDASTQRSREAFARLVGVPSVDVAGGSQGARAIAAVAGGTGPPVPVLLAPVQIASLAVAVV